MRSGLEQLTPSQREALAVALLSPRYELVPTSRASERISGFPRDVTYTVTASPRRGLDATIDLSVALTEAGHRAVPHLAARSITDRGHLEKTARRLADAGVVDVFVIGGDGAPIGQFDSALDVIEGLLELGHAFRIGIAGYPEPHPLIDEAALQGAMEAKAAYASYVVTQMCFDAVSIAAWLARVRDEGVGLPVVFGVPGSLAVPRLLPVAMRIGVGDSLRYLTRHRSSISRLLKPVYSPTDLIVSLASMVPMSDALALHLYTFNQVAATEEWRLRLLDSLRDT